ncbi:MAG: saccharopine dehydrogenase NADP-binding domain-containing protein [Planctomycetota bacterium]
MPDTNLLEKLCLVGDHVAGDPSHFMIEHALGAMGVDWRFLSFQPPADRLGEALTGLDALGFRGVRLRGAMQDAAAAGDDGSWKLTERAGRTGRATHLTRHEGVLQADDAAGPAVIEAIAAAVGEAGDPAGKRVLVLGAGGVARSVADVLVERGAGRIAVADRSAEHAAALVLATQQRTASVDANVAVNAVAWEPGWFEAPDGVDWIISTAEWPKEDNEQVAASVAPEMPTSALAIDLGVGSTRAPMLLRLADRGLATLDGLAVLVAETALALEAWTDQAVDRGVLRDAAEEFLGL